jgi:hypothetical protein
MKKQINPTIKAHLLRGAFYLLLAVCAIPFALAQRNTAAAKMSRMVPASTGTLAIPPNPDSAHIPAGAPATAFGLSVPKVANAPLGRHTGVGGDASVIGNNPLLTYMIDDGTAEVSIGYSIGGSFVALNSFPVTGGNNLITSISIAWGSPAHPDPSLDGLPYTAVLWGDPNGDGSPTDAVVLATAPGVISQQGTNTFLTSVITPTLVTTPNFFVGFVITHSAGQHPAAFDQTPPTFPIRSWLANTANINDLSGAFPIEAINLVGNWLIRAEGEAGTPTPTPTGTPTPTPTPTPTACIGPYTIDQIGGSIVPGMMDIGNHCLSCTTPITLPFSYTLYDRTYTVVNVGGNGTLQFGSNVPIAFNSCLPNVGFSYTIFPYWDDLRTDANSGCASYPGGTCGIYTTVEGTAPNRIFDIEYRAVYFLTPTMQANFELRLYEGQQRFDVIYGTVANGNTTATAGVQKDVAPNFTQYFCNGSGGAATGGQSYTLQPCPSPTPTATATATPTATATFTPTATPTATHTPTPTPTATFTPTTTATFTPTPTATFTPTPRSPPSPRPRPTPAPRP